MNIKDKSVYLNYIQDIENKINNLCTGANLAMLSDAQKQSVEKIRTQIMAKAALFSIRATSKTGLIPHADWILFKQEIDGLCKQLADIADGAKIMAHIAVRECSDR